MKTENPKQQSTQHKQGEEFIRLFMSHERRIFGLILSLLPVWSDADDVMQETATVLWRKFDDFEIGTNFSAWAFKIARFQVLAFYKKQRRRQALFSDETFQKLAEQSLEREHQVDHRHLALQNCLGKLKQRDREIVQLRYQPEATTRDVATKVNRSMDVIYKSLNRIHTQLLSCIQRELKSEEAR